MLQNVRASIWLIVSLSVLGACGTTRRFIAQPPLTVDDPQKDARQAAGNLCKQGSAGITATGMGGLLLPLRLHVTELTVSKQSQAGDGWAIDASLRSKVDAISPMCQTAHGQIISRENNTIAVQLEHFYCNWVVVGNVLVNADLSIDNISLKDKVFTGF